MNTYSPPLDLTRNLIKNHIIKLSDQLEYYREQNKAEKGRNSLIDFERAIFEVAAEIKTAENELNFINNLVKKDDTK